MTQGLLNSAFHDKSQGERRRDLEEFRAQLARAVFAPVGRSGDLDVQAADLPLFKRGRDGLRQVVRFRLLGGAAGSGGRAASGLALALDGPEGSEGHRWPFTEAEGEGLVADAEVPEVATPADVNFKVLSREGDVLWRGRVRVQPQRKWSVSLVHHSHLDVGYTDRQEVVMANHLQYLDSVLDLVDHTSDWDDDAHFRWNVEVSWPLERWFASRSPQDRARMVEAVRAGSVSVGALSLNLHTEACAIEELYEMVRFAVDLRREHDVPVLSAMQTDVPGGVTALVEVLADIGVKYLSVAHNYAGRSVPYLIGGEKLARPFYWRSPSGKKLLVWQTDTLHGNAYMEGNIIGLAGSYATSLQALPCYLAALARRPYPFDSGTWLPEADKVERSPYPHDILHLRVQGKYGDNAPPNLAVSEIAKQWNATWAYPHLRVDVNEGFFQAAEARLGESIPEWQGDWADWWADGLGSGARMLSWARQAQSSARTGRTFHSLACALGGSAPVPVDGVSQTYQDIGLFDEHTWGARHPWDDDEEGWGSGALQWEHKASFARNARERATDLLSSGARRTAARIGVGKGLASIVVLNPSAWARTDVVKVFLPFSTVPPGIEVAVEDDRDGTKVATAGTAQENVDHRPLGRFLSFLATEVPPSGYARFNVVEGAPLTSEVSEPGGTVVANEHYRVRFSPLDASISSLTELATGRELVNTGAVLGFNAYVFDRYGTSTRVDHLSGRVFSHSLELIAERAVGEAAVVLRQESSDLGESITADIRAPGCARLLSTVSVWRGVPRVEVHNRMWKQRTVDKQSVFFAFPFSAPGADVVYELPGIGTSASAPVVPGCPRHMRAVRNWVAMAGPSGGTAWATADAPLVQFGDIHSPYSPFPGTLRMDAPEPATIYSWALNNIWDTNFPTEQGGEMNFRYAVASTSDGDARALGMRLGEAVASPLTATVVPASTEGGRMPASGSLCSIERPEVRLVQATAAGDGAQLLLWLNNQAEVEVTTGVDLPDLTFSSARLGSVFEEGQAALAVAQGSLRVTLGPGETRAVALVQPRWARSGTLT